MSGAIYTAVMIPERDVNPIDGLVACPFCGVQPWSDHGEYLRLPFFERGREDAAIECRNLDCKVRPSIYMYSSSSFSSNRGTWEDARRAWNARPTVIGERGDNE